jgi:hypothetical protein
MPNVIRSPVVASKINQRPTSRLGVTVNPEPL